MPHQGIPLSLDSAEDVESGLEKIAKENFRAFKINLRSLNLFWNIKNHLNLFKVI